MLFPSICIDNFFTYPDRVVEFSKTLEYTLDKEGRWPGKRSKQLHLIDSNFFSFFASKCLSVLYPIEYTNINYKLDLKFQSISKNYKQKGWVHKDNPVQLTVIVYLSKHKNCGTSLYDYKTLYPIQKHMDIKQKNYKDVKNSSPEKYVEDANNNFEETIRFNSKYNRIIMFDSNHWHAASKFIEENVNEDRLTLIGFFTEISAPFLKFACVENSRI